jgi:aminoglycoside/choline kinase family phosphotransferase
MTRTESIDVFLASRGWRDAGRLTLAGDASARRYERIVDGGRRAILMDVPPESGLSVDPFVAVTAYLRDSGFSAPEILGESAGEGLLLIEDLGDDLLARLCAEDPAREADLYAAAIDTLVAFHALQPPEPSDAWSAPPYDMAVLTREARLVLEWYVPCVTGRAVAADLAAEFEALMLGTFAPVAKARSGPVYRDYHAENLIWLPRRAGVARIGLLDYQDLLVGHPAYDVVSLLGDARRDVPPDLVAAMVERYLARTGLDRHSFVAAAHVLGAQRNLKILGLFTRLCRRDGKARYIDLLPRVWRLLLADLEHPDLARLSHWVARHVPPPEAAARARLAGVAA